MAGERERVHPKSRAEWRAWLERNHADSPGIWLLYYKKATGKPRLEYDEIVEEALCFGWVDSRAGRLDDERSMLLITPRRPKSGWSKPNKERIRKLKRAGLLTEAGLEAVEVAKRNGAWTVLDGPEALEMPADLHAAFEENMAAKENYEAFPPSAKKVILAWIATAKREETRSKRIVETVRSAARNERANQ